MTPAQQRLHVAAFWCGLLSAASVVASIFVSQVLLGLALVLLAASRAPLIFPPLKAPLLAFFGWTVLSLLLSGHVAGGLPQVKKFFVFSMLLVLFSVIREARQARWLAGAWFVIAAASALLSLGQFGRKLHWAQERGEDFYQSYVGERITGFLSHWMTFSEVGMLVLLLLLSWLLFGPRLSRKILALVCLCAAVLAASLLVSFTRSIWLATGAGSVYLVWHWRKKLLWAAPLLLLAAVGAAPGAVKKRVGSMLDAHSDNSTSARMIMWRTGWRMIQARPLLGLGSERVQVEFRSFLPPDAGELPPAYYGHLHNLYIHYAAERGIPAVLALLWLFARILRDHRRALGQQPALENRFILHAVVAATIGIAVNGFFEVNLGDSEVLTVYLALVSLGYVTSQGKEAGERA